MNMMGLNRLQPESPEEQNAIYKIAESKSRTNPEYRPITLELRDTSIGDRRGAGFHSFEFFTSTVADGGRTRDINDVRIVDKFVSFILHPDFRGLMLNVPSTQLNLDMLASHKDQNVFIIHQDDIAAEVERRAEVLRKTKPVIEKEDDKAELERLRARLEELEGAKSEEKQAVGSFGEESSELAEIGDGPDGVWEDYQAEERQVDGPPAEQTGTSAAKKKYTQEQKDAARKAVHEKYGAEIDTLGERYYLTPKYRKWYNEALVEVA